MMEAAKAGNDKAMQRKLEKLRSTLGYDKIGKECEKMTNTFRTELNKMSASKKY